MEVVPLKRREGPATHHRRGRCPVRRRRRSAREALDELEADPVIRDALGEHVFRHFVDAKRAEWDAFRLHVSQWELDRYLEAF